MSRSDASFLLYGAAGYTGRLLAAAARGGGWRPILADRDAEGLARVASALGLDARAIELDDEPRLRRLVEAVPLVLHAAGPFADTWRPMTTACLRAGTHYLDITGEVDVVEAIARLDGRARHRGVMLLPAVGFDAVPFDCLAAELAAQVPDARSLRFTIAFSPSPALSRGSARTLLRDADRPVRVRRQGVITVPERTVPEMTVQAAPVTSAPVNTAAIACAFHSTGIGEIDAYGMLPWTHRFAQAMARSPRRRAAIRPWRSMLTTALRWWPAGPSAARLASARASILAEVADRRHRWWRAALDTPEAYATTVITALAAVRRVLAGDWTAGFQTPSRAFGSDFALSCDGIVRGAL